MDSYLKSINKQFEYYKMLGEKTISQVPTEKLFWKPHSEGNSISIIIKHLSGNMLSRWTNFLTADGEKEWRKRDEEFVDSIQTNEEMLTAWQKGWEVLFLALNSLSIEDLEKEVYIRNMGHTVIEAINRQLAHYAYHIGQIVLIGKIIKNETWVSLSIPVGDSTKYNRAKFLKPKRKEHFTDDL